MPLCSGSWATVSKKSHVEKNSGETSPPLEQGDLQINAHVPALTFLGLRNLHWDACSRNAALNTILFYFQDYMKYLLWSVDTWRRIWMKFLSVFLSGSACVLLGLIIPFLCPGLFLTVTSGWHKVLPLWWGGSPIPWKPSCQRLHNSIALLGSPDCIVCLSQNVIVAKIKCWVRSHSWGGGVFLPGFQQRRQH